MQDGHRVSGHHNHQAVLFSSQGGKAVYYLAKGHCSLFVSLSIIEDYGPLLMLTITLYVLLLLLRVSNRTTRVLRAVCINNPRNCSLFSRE